MEQHTQSNQVNVMPDYAVAHGVTRASAGMTDYVDGLVQDCNISSVLAMGILQSCTETSMYRLARPCLSCRRILVPYPLTH